jgi:hypothetical protein
VQDIEVFSPGYFNCTEAPEMRCHKLGIEKLIACNPETINEVHKCNL